MLVKPSGAITFLDAGITTELSARDQRNFVALFSAIVRGDGYLAGKLMIDNASEHRCQDPEAFCQDMASLVRDALGSRLRLQSIGAGQILTRAFQLACDHRVRVESNFASICVAIMVLEGLGRNLDPGMDVLAAAVPVLAKQAIRSKIGGSGAG